MLQSTRFLGSARDEERAFPSNPTASSIQRGYSDVSSATAKAGLSIGSGRFDSVSSVGIQDQQAGGGPAAGAEGCYGDTVTVGGAAGSGTLVVPVHVTGSLFATFVIPGQVLLDQDGQVVPGAIVQSALGVDYLTPEPDSSAMTAAALLALGLGFGRRLTARAS